MRVQLALVLCTALFLGGCVTGNTYPGERARIYCDALFSCVDDDEIEFWTGYDDRNECVDEEVDGFEDRSDYQSYLAGDCPFQSDEADRCLEEVSDVRQDPDCDGNMGFLAFAFDIADEDCDEVYCN